MKYISSDRILTHECRFCWKSCFVLFQHVLADVCVQQLSNTGLSDQQYFCRTHLGHLLNPGDTVLGYDLIV